MSAHAVSNISSPNVARLRHTSSHRHLILPRVVAGLPLLGIGVAHAFVADAPMRPLVEAAGFPMAGIIAPLAVATEIVAGISLLLGLFARIGGMLAVPVMLGAVYSHLVIGVWPNGEANEPPLMLPLLVLAAATWVLWRGAGRWSLDARSPRRDRS